MSRRSRPASGFTHPLHAEPRRRRTKDLLGSLLTGVTLGVFSLGVYALVGPDETPASTPSSGTVLVEAPVDPVLERPEVADLLACLERYRDEGGSGQSTDAETMARAQESCARELRAELEETLTHDEG